jgi:hypothetical protein
MKSIKLTSSINYDRMFDRINWMQNCGSGINKIHTNETKLPSIAYFFEAVVN